MSQSVFCSLLTGSLPCWERGDSRWLKGTAGTAPGHSPGPACPAAGAVPRGASPPLAHRGTNAPRSSFSQVLRRGCGWSEGWHLPLRGSQRVPGVHLSPPSRASPGSSFLGIHLDLPFQGFTWSSPSRDLPGSSLPGLHLELPFHGFTWIFLFRDLPGSSHPGVHLELPRQALQAAQGTGGTL